MGLFRAIEHGMEIRPIPQRQGRRTEANYPKIRMFTVKKTSSIKPLAEASGSWVECSPQTVSGFSGVGYFFARDLHLKLGIPVGMIHTSWG